MSLSEDLKKRNKTKKKSKITTVSKPNKKPARAEIRDILNILLITKKILVHLFAGAQQVNALSLLYWKK